MILALQLAGCEGRLTPIATPIPSALVPGKVATGDTVFIELEATDLSLRPGMNAEVEIVID